MKRAPVVVPAIVLGALAPLVVGVGPAGAADGGRPFHLALTGAAERPGPGDPDGTGTAHLRVNPGLGQLCYEVTVSGVDPITAAHVHVAPSTAAGPVVIPLAPFTGDSTSGCADVPRELALAILQEPGSYYLNVHNATYPAGALRAQLR